MTPDMDKWERHRRAKDALLDAMRRRDVPRVMVERTIIRDLRPSLGLPQRQRRIYPRPADYPRSVCLVCGGLNSIHLSTCGGDCGGRIVAFRAN